MAQLVVRSLPTPEVRGSNPVIGKKIVGQCLLSTVLKIRKNKQKEAGNSLFKKSFHVRPFSLILSFQCTVRLKLSMPRFEPTSSCIGSDRTVTAVSSRLW